MLASWQTQYSGRYARVVERTGGQAVATWPSAGLRNTGGGQAKPAYSDIQQVGYSASYVYINGTGLASHQMGPWYDEMGNIFGNWPSNQNYLHRFPRHPQPATSKTTNGLGPLGRWVNGVAFFNLLDGFSYDASRGTEGGGPGQSSGGLWMRNAVVVEQPTFDASNAHQPQNGEYHYHDNPVALRYQLGDNVAFDAGSGRYREDTSRLHHSPILGWSNDGYPIYGPYGYASATNAGSGIRRMVSGFVLRDGTQGAADLRQTGRHSLAKWAAALHGVSTALAASQYGPNVTTQYTLGRYVEDFDFLGDLGQTQGRDFDLDVYNGRYCVTPEYPGGTYAYFVTINADGSPAFPYVIGRQWYGTPSGGAVPQITETVTMYKNAGPGSAVQVTVTGSGSGKQLAWTSVEGGIYKIEGTADGGKTWTGLASNVTSQGLKTTYAVGGLGGVSVSSYRVTLTALAPYDSTGRQR